MTAHCARVHVSVAFHALLCTWPLPWFNLLLWNKRLWGQAWLLPVFLSLCLSVQGPGHQSYNPHQPLLQLDVPARNATMSEITEAMAVLALLIPLPMSRSQEGSAASRLEIRHAQGKVQASATHQWAERQDGLAAPGMIYFKAFRGTEVPLAQQGTSIYCLLTPHVNNNWLDNALGPGPKYANHQGETQG